MSHKNIALKQQHFMFLEPKESSQTGNNLQQVLHKDLKRISMFLHQKTKKKGP